MKKVISKVAPAGYGKTKWLCTKANFYSNNRYVFYYGSERKYGKFCELYFSMFNEVCPVIYLSRENFSDLMTDDVVLIDDAMKYSEISDIMKSLSSVSCIVLLTVEGTTDENEIEKDTYDPNQLTIFNTLNEVKNV